MKLAFILALFVLPLLSRADGPLPPAAPVNESGGVARADKGVGILPPKSDPAIASRLRRILSITGWFENLKVSSQEGVVTLYGTVAEPSQREWAMNLAQDAEGVVAVIDKISLKSAPWLDLQPTRKELHALWKSAFAFLPHLLIAVVILFITVFLFRWTNLFSRLFWTRRLDHPVLADVMGKLGALPVLLVGLYLALQVLGLTGLAFTILGGTGAIGLVAGFAFKNILENYFSGIMLSIRKPFMIGDVIEVAGEKGVVFRMTTRGTTLVDFNGNHVMIPNSTVFTNIIRNHTASPTSRLRLSLPLDPEQPAETQRRRAVEYLRSRPEIESTPALEVCVSGQELEIYFWINVRETSADKLRNLLLSELSPAIRGQEALPTTAEKPSTSANVVDILQRAKQDSSPNPAERDLLREQRL